MTISVSSVSTRTVALGTATISRPGTVADGDKLLVFVLSQSGTGQTLGAPAGWNELQSQFASGPNDLTWGSFWRDAVSEPATYAFTTTSAGVQLQAHLIGLRGVPLGGAAFLDHSTTTWSTPSETSSTVSGTSMTTPVPAGILTVFSIFTVGNGANTGSTATGSFVTAITDSNMVSATTGQQTVYEFGNWSSFGNTGTPTITETSVSSIAKKGAAFSTALAPSSASGGGLQLSGVA